ncbi:protein TCL1B2-like [Mesocricetus auratus]|uniref:Protein TCL1B2-like n=1 Tax=Mesocricetus auratus TaxID=10036 RepID=A0A3Q0CMH5_MESAU|nr:protein TCL1B2-like [Mesocricetus auratus]
MAAASLLPPVTLTREIPGYYRDENRRLWMVVSLLFTSDHPTHDRPGTSIMVTLWQVGECCKELLPHFFSIMPYLPRMLQRHSVFSYSGTDSRMWKLVNHYRLGDTEHLILEMETELVNSPACSTQP